MRAGRRLTSEVTSLGRAASATTAMPKLERVLLDHDLSLLRVMADLWGIELSAPNQREAAEEVARQMLQRELVTDIVEALPPEAQAALQAVAYAGRLPLAQFSRQHGELRSMGAGRRDREQPWHNAPSPAEALWYRGLIARGFFDEGHGSQEFVFVADDLLALLPVAPAAPSSSRPPGTPARAPATWLSSANLAAHDVTTLLAYLQIASVKLEGASFPPRHRAALGPFLRLPPALDLFTHLVIHLGLASGAPLKLNPALARPFLEAPLAEQVASLVPAWRDSREWNDLLHVPGLVFEGGAWRNDPWTARLAILEMAGEIPAGEWWSLAAFAAAIKERRPDFQRPAGDYDSWYVRDAETQSYLRGFEHWDRVDGALVRWLVSQPMYWLGMVDDAPEAQAFRVTPYGAAFFGHAPWPSDEDAAPPPIRVSADGMLRVPAGLSRYDRFQVARVSNWLPPEGQDYLYRLAPASLGRAAKQGIRVSHLLAFLHKAGGEALPPTLVGALQRWDRVGGEAALRDVVVLKLKTPELAETLRRTPGVKRYLGESLGPTAVAVRREAVEQLRAALAELGILLD